MTINQLPVLATPTADTVVPVSYNGADYKLPLGTIKPETYTLIDSATVATGTADTYDSRRISDYRLLCFVWVVNNMIRATAISPLGLFQAFGVSLFYVDSGNTQRYCEVSQSTDTQISMVKSGNASGSLYVYGISLL